MKKLILVTFLLFSCHYQLLRTPKVKVFIEPIKNKTDYSRSSRFIKNALQQIFILNNFQLVSKKDADMNIFLNVEKYDLANISFEQQKSGANSSQITYRPVNSRITLSVSYDIKYKKKKESDLVIGLGDYYENLDLKIQRDNAFRVASKQVAKALFSKIISFIDE